MKTFKIFQKVNCPPDMGGVGYIGVITHINDTVCKNHRGEEFQWITVKDFMTRPQTKHVWPSNRLGSAEFSK